MCVDEGVPEFDWTLVRRVVGESWHPINDNLEGSEAYGEPVCSTCDGTFSIPFNNMYYTHFLFETGDGEKWLIATVDAVIGENYNHNSRPIVASSNGC